MKYLKCDICNKKPTALYMVKNKLWNKYLSREIVCIECFRRIIERDLNINDIDNKDIILQFCNNWLTEELLNELNQGEDITKKYLKENEYK